MLPAFKLSGPVGANVRIKKDDTLQTKRALLRLGFLEPSSEGVTPVADDAMIAAIKSFQKENKIAKDGAMKPGGPTERLIQAALFEEADGANAKDSPAFRIGGAVGPGGTNRPEDVLKAKRALSLAGIISADEVNGKMADRTFGGAIEAFQRDFNLKRDGKITPGGETERALARVTRPVAARDTSDKRPFKQVASLARAGDVMRDFGIDESEATPPEPFQSGEEKLPKKRDPELEILLRDWSINKKIPGTDHPMLKEILIEMSKVRQMTATERRKLEEKIKKFESLDRNHTSLRGTLQEKMKRAENKPYFLPRVLSDKELEQFLELDRFARDLSRKINGAGEKVVSPSRPEDPPDKVPSVSTRLAAVQKFVKKANLPAALITFFSGVAVNHYDQFVRMYEAEIKRRKLLRTHP